MEAWRLETAIHENLINVQNSVNRWFLKISAVIGDRGDREKVTDHFIPELN